jgi:hypothetical protein
MLKQTIGKIAIAVAFANVFSILGSGMFAQSTIAGEVNSPKPPVSLSAVELGEPLTMNCQVATLTMKAFFFTEQKGQQIAVDCASIVLLPRQTISGYGSSMLPDGSVIIKIPLNGPELQPDRLILFRQPL